MMKKHYIKKPNDVRRISMSRINRGNPWLS
jgi:hypothetical protein